MGTWALQHSEERDYRQASEGGSRDQIRQSGALYNYPRADLIQDNKLDLQKEADRMEIR